MSAEIESHFGNFCRTCMTQDNEADTEFQSIFDTIPNTDKRISELLSILIECYTFKDLPNRMCGKCVQRIGDVHEFQQMCLRSQSQFLQMTEDKEYSGEIVVPSELIVDATLKESDPLRDAECMLEVKIEEYGRDQGQYVSRFETSSLNNEAEVTWKNTEEGCEARACDYDESFQQSGTGTVHACDICGKQYMILSDLKKHEKCHARKAAKKTSDCRDEENAATPLKINEGGKSKTKKSHKCEYCHKAFYQIGTLRDHIRTHTGEQPFLCSECGKAFNSSSNMKQHLLRHAGVKRYECPSCPKKFPCLSDLASHKAVHSKVKPHICDICGASFGKPYQLRTHKMYHNGEKPHKCEYCEMRFVMADHMRRHMRTHTGEKPYKCKYCDRAFAQSNDLIKHLRSHLGENVYRCELCPKGFRLAAELRAHFSQHKNDDESETEKNLKELADYERNLNVQKPS